MLINHLTVFEISKISSYEGTSMYNYSLASKLNLKETVFLFLMFDIGFWGQVLRCGISGNSIMPCIGSVQQSHEWLASIISFPFSVCLLAPNSWKFSCFTSFILLLFWEWSNNDVSLPRSCHVHSLAWKCIIWADFPLFKSLMNSYFRPHSAILPYHLY